MGDRLSELERQKDGNNSTATLQSLSQYSAKVTEYAAQGNETLARVADLEAKTSEMKQVTTGNDQRLCSA